MTTPHRTRNRDDAGKTSRRSLADSAGRIGALLLLAFASACAPATPTGGALSPTPRGSYSWSVEPGDLIRLKNWGAPEQSGDLIVNERGIVLIPTVGHIPVQGMSPDSLERTIVRAFSGRVDASRVDVQILRPITVTGGVRQPNVQIADASASVLSLVAKSGGAIRTGGDSRVFLVRTGTPTREVSVADRIGDLDVRSSDQLYVQDPSFAIRNDVTIRAAYAIVQFIATIVTVYYLIRQN
ncbi:MAG: polysaccharide biosynthesis/export family protein [bacterium]